MVQRLSFCLCAFLLLASAGSAFAQTPPPFTFSFTQSQYSGAENDRFLAAYVTVTGTVPNDTPFRLSFTEMPSGKVTTTDLTWTQFSESPRRISVINDDLYFNPGRSVTVKIVSLGNGGAIVEPSTATVTIIDNEAPPAVSINDVTIVEGTPQPGMAITPNFANFTVSLASAFPTPVTIPLLLHDGTAKRGQDYDGPLLQLVVFGPEEQSKTITVPIDRDIFPEGDETFTVELQPQLPVLPGKTIGTCTILDDDDAVSPSLQNVAIGEKGIIHLRLTDPAVADEHVILQASDPAMFTVPASVTIPAGASEAHAEFLCLKVGAGSVLVTLPPSRGGRTYELSVTVHDNTTLTVDPIQINFNLGTTANVTARVDPLPSGPLRVLFTPATSGIVSVPDVILTGADGRVVIPIHAMGLGATTATLSLLDINGGASTTLGITVTLGAGPVVTSVVPATGRQSGGDSVHVNGFNFSNPCTLTLGGVAVPVANVQPGNSNTVFVVTPPHAPGVVDLSIRCGTRSFVFPNAFSYQPAAAKPVFISPKSGTTRGGTLVDIEGTDLRYQSCVARFGDAMASLVASHDTTVIGVQAPPHPAGIVDISLVCGSETITVPNAFTYVAADDPPLQSFATYPPLEQGKSALISVERGFRLDDEVLINDVVVPNVTSPELGFHVFTVPDLVGQATLTVRDYAGRRTSRTVTINPPATPVLTTLPDRVTLGAEFSIDAEGLRPGLTYTFGPAPMHSVRDATLSYADHSVCWGCFLPTVFRAPVSLGTGNFSFTIADHGTIVATKTVAVTASGPAVNTVTPQCAAYDGGSLVTISGSGFNDGVAVRFSTTYAPEVIVKDPFTIIAKVPPSYGTLNPQIAVINPDGTTATLTNAFRYMSPSEPPCGSGGRHRAAGH